VSLALLDWEWIGRDLDAVGCAVIERVLSAEECRTLTASYDDESLFRSRVVMSRHGFGRGEYKYFAYPLPERVHGLRGELYTHLVPVANRWNETMGIDARFPPGHSDYVAQCHDAGQNRPTPLLLRYVAGDYNCLHQDVYGDLLFPLQAAFLLSAPDEDFTGGAFVLTEQRPRMQSRVEVVPLRQGDGGHTESICGTV